MSYDITMHKLTSEALRGRYYSFETNAWRSMGWIEWIARCIFCPLFCDSVSKTCLDRSWQSIEKMPELPVHVQSRIQGLFYDSLYPTNPISAQSGVISRIFCRVFLEKEEREGVPVQEIDVKQGYKSRLFGIFCNQQLHYTVTSSRYGRFDFYDRSREKAAINDYDSLWDTQGKRLGGIKLAVNYTRQPSAIALYGDDDCLLAEVEKNKSGDTLVMRDPQTKRVLAVSSFVPKEGLIHWKITPIEPGILDVKGLSPMLMAWSALKYSQHEHFPNPRQLKYVPILPTKTFISI